MPGGSFCSFFRHELGPVVRGVVGRDPLLHPGGLAGLVVLRVRAPHVRGRVFRFPEARDRTSGSDQSNTPANSRTKYLHATYPRYCDGWCIAFWMYFYPTLLCFEFNLELSDLLHVRIFVPGVCHFDYYLLGDDDFVVLLSSVCRGKTIF